MAYRLDGPNGLPREGWWYANKVSRTWGGRAARRRCLVRPGRDVKQISCPAIAAGENRVRPWAGRGADVHRRRRPIFLRRADPAGDRPPTSTESLPLRVGEVDPERKQHHQHVVPHHQQGRTLKPGQALTDHFVLFAGPKRPRLLDQYSQGRSLYYGWFGWVAEPMLQVLHIFYYRVPQLRAGHHHADGAGAAVHVPLEPQAGPERPEDAGAAAGDQEAPGEIQEQTWRRGRKAQQELFRKHNYNPLGGCLVLFIQLPIFVGLYRSLMVDVELRDAPLFTEAVRWCSNLAAPDMLYDWSWLHAGLCQQRHRHVRPGAVLQHPAASSPSCCSSCSRRCSCRRPTDEQAAMQQKVMKYMMIFMGVMFFKVASGLCIYFIASSLWGLAERKFLPKTAAAAAERTSQPATGEEPPGRPTANDNGGGGRRTAKDGR